MEFIIADDHVLFRETLGEYLKRYLPICHVTFVSDFNEAYEMLENGKEPDLLILDYNMQGMDHGKSLKKVRENFPQQKVALMSGVVDAYQVRTVIDYGAVAYFPKTLSGKDLIRGITQVVEGDVFIPMDAQTGELMPAYYSDEADGLGRSANGGLDAATILTQKDIDLSKRENQILSTLLKGMTNKEIANSMGIQEVTVKMHVSRVCQKFGVKNRTQVVIKARDMGFREE